MLKSLTIIALLLAQTTLAFVLGGPLARGVVVQERKTGSATVDFERGVSALIDAQQPWRWMTLLPTAGMVLVVFVSSGRKSKSVKN